jgi:hypothetical protein
MIDSLVPIASMITAITGVCTFALALFIAYQANKIHEKTDELVIHTNSLTDKLMEKTDVLARAEGVKEGIALQPIATIEDPVVLAAKIIDVAADKLATTVAAALAATVAAKG